MGKSTYNAIDCSFQVVCSRDVFYQISLALWSVKHCNQLAEFYNWRATYLRVSSIALNKLIEIVFEVFIKSSRH